jgi:hypothetical protein
MRGEEKDLRIFDLLSGHPICIRSIIVAVELDRASKMDSKQIPDQAKNGKEFAQDVSPCIIWPHRGGVGIVYDIIFVSSCSVLARIRTQRETD